MPAHRKSTAVNCDICGKTISRKADLSRHMKVHAPNKEDLMHCCTYHGCTYKTLQKSNFDTHLNTHTGERPNRCPEEGCDFSCGDPGSLTKHRMRKHRYEPKANSSSQASARTLKEVRQHRRFSPYPSSSTSSTTSSSSSPDPSGDDERSPLLQPHNFFEQIPPSSLLTRDCGAEGCPKTIPMGPTMHFAFGSRMDVNPRPVTLPGASSSSFVPVQDPDWNNHYSDDYSIAAPLPSYPDGYAYRTFIRCQL